jgi:DNA-binding MarR family transcriptional regulator
MSAQTQECAREILDVIPLVMRDIRTQMRSRRTPDLTIPQFRTLLFVNRNVGASLSQVADHMGLTMPSTSKLVDALIKGELMTRQEHPSDRRRVSLVVTQRGFTLLEASRKGTLAYLTEKLEGISSSETETILKAMKALRMVFHN